MRQDFQSLIPIYSVSRDHDQDYTTIRDILESGAESGPWPPKGTPQGSQCREMLIRHGYPVLGTTICHADQCYEATNHLSSPRGRSLVWVVLSVMERE